MSETSTVKDQLNRHALREFEGVPDSLEGYPDVTDYEAAGAILAALAENGEVDRFKSLVSTVYVILL